MYWVILKLLWSFKKKSHLLSILQKCTCIFFFFWQTTSFGKEIKSKENKFDSKWFSVNSSVLLGVCKNARICSSFFSASSFVIQKSQTQHFFFLHWLYEDISKFQINSSTTFQRSSEKQAEFQMELSSWTLKWHFNKHRGSEVRKLTNYQLRSRASSVGKAWVKNEYIFIFMISIHVYLHIKPYIYE